MGTALAERPRTGVIPTLETTASEHKTEIKRASTVYAIVFDLDTETLQNEYHAAAYNNAYYDIRKRLAGHNFAWQQGSVYFGDRDKVNAVSCVLAVMDLARTFPWFTPSVRDIRMLRIEEQNDLMPILLGVSGATPEP